MIKFLYLLIFPLLLNAQVFINAPKSFLIDEPIIFSISANGSNVEFPNITNIAGNPVQNAGTSSQTSIRNGVRNQKLVRKYRFFSTSNVTIPSFEIKVNGNIEKTKEQKVILQKVKKTKSNNFNLTLKINKKNVYVGEEILLTMTFKYKKNIQLYDLKFSQPDFENFWSKQINSSQQPNDNIYIIQELHYLLFPQKSGTLNIPTFRIDAMLPDLNARNNFFGSASITKKIYSNSLKIEVNQLPENVQLIGDFKIKSFIDKSTIKEGEAVSYKLEISGRGNIDDVEEFNLNIPNTTIYDNPSKKDFNIENGKYGGIYKKSYSIVSNSDFKIPSVTIKYFDKKTKQVKIIKTKEYNIKVQSPIIKEQKQLEVKKENIQPIIQPKTKVITKVVKTTDKEKIIFFILGMLCMIIIFTVYLILKNRTKVKEDLPLATMIKKSSNQEELLRVIVPFVKINENLDKIIYRIELEKIQELKTTKKELIQIIKELKL